MSVNILGICGSHVKGGNTEHFLKESLKAAEKEGDISIKIKGTYAFIKVPLKGTIKAVREYEWS